MTLNQITEQLLEAAKQLERENRELRMKVTQLTADNERMCDQFAEWERQASMQREAMGDG